MANFAYLSDKDNLVRRPGVTLTASSQATGFPVSNLAVLPVSKPWRSTEHGSAWILIDLGYPVAPDLIALINHNLSDAATISLHAGNTFASLSLIATLSWHEHDLFKNISGSYRFWRLVIADPGNLDGYIQAGYIGLGDSTVFGTGSGFGSTLTPVYVNTELETEGGIPHVQALFERRRFTLPLKAIDLGDLDDLVTLVDDCKRSARPIFFLPDSSIDEGYLVRLVEDPAYSTPDWIDYRDTRLEFIEESRGLQILEPQPLIYNAGEVLADLGSVMDRDSVAMQMSENLALESKAIDTARDGHHPTLGTRSLLLEESRINGFTYSEQLDNAAWSKAEATVSANAVAAPDGTITADKLVESNAETAHYAARATPTLTNNTKQAFTLYAKAAERSIVWLRSYNKANDVKTTWFNLSTDVIGENQHGSGNVRITPCTGGWYRLEIVFDSSSGGTTPMVMFGLAIVDGAMIYDGDGSSGAYFWGMQFEVDKPFASSYVKTIADPITRAADTLYVPFDTPPQQMTVYARFVEHGTVLAGDPIGCFYIGHSDGGGAQFYIYANGSVYICYLYTGSENRASSLITAPAIGDTVELRATLKQDGKIQIHQSINGGAETSAAEAAAITLPAAWNDTRAYFNSRGVKERGFNAFQSVKVLRGVQSLASCRAAKTGEMIERF